MIAGRCWCRTYSCRSGWTGSTGFAYKAWEEGTTPDFVLELPSARTWRRDVAAKPPLYEAIGVGEYWIFDPIGKLPEPIVGRRLDAAGVYRPVREQSGGGYYSEVLGLDLIVHGDGFRFRDPTTGENPPDHVEAVAQRDLEATARQAAGARVAQLEERLRQP